MKPDLNNYHDTANAASKPNNSIKRNGYIIVTAIFPKKKLIKKKIAALEVNS